MAAVTRSRAIKARRLLSSRVMVCVTVLDMQRQLTDLRPEVLSWLATVPVAERPADAVEVVGSRADDRHMGIGLRDGRRSQAFLTRADFLTGMYSKDHEGSKQNHGQGAGDYSGRCPPGFGSRCR